MARPSSVCVRTIDSSRSLSHGFWMKSRAPRRIASTATSTEPHAVITTTGSDSSAVWMRGQQVEPLFAGGGVAGVVEVDQDDVVVLQLERARVSCAGEVAVSMT